MRRGDLVTIAFQGDYGKPCPALVIQGDAFLEHTSVTVLPLTSYLVDAPLLRPTIKSSEDNHLTKESQVMIDKIMTVKTEKVGPVFGHISAAELLDITRRLSVFLGIG